MTEDRTRCEETVAAVEEYVAGTLDPKRVAAFEAHVAVCEACHVALEEAQEAVEGVLSGIEVDEEGVAGPLSRIHVRWLVLIGCAVTVSALIALASWLPSMTPARESARRSSSGNNLKQLAIVFKLYAGDSPNGVYPPLSAYGGVWVPDVESIYPEILTDYNVLLDPRYPYTMKTDAKMDVAFSQNPVDFEFVTLTVAKSYVYLGHVVRDVAELEQFVQGVAAYAPEQREDGIPADDGGLLPRLRVEVEKFFVTDVNDTEEVSRIASEIPLMFEVPYPEGDPRHIGSYNVLYLDGHVELVPYGKRFPALPEVAALMKGAGVLE